VFVKVAAGQSDLLAYEVAPGELPPAAVINRYSGQTDPIMLEAHELIRHFHKVFHNVDSHAPQSKETGQALSLISQHGLDAAQRVVNFAHSEAVRTNFSIQNFGAVLSYTSRALAESGRRKSAARPTSPIAEPATPNTPRYERGEQRLASLSPEQYARRHEKAKADLFREKPFLANARSAGSSLIARTLQSRMVRELENEVMDILVFDPALTARFPWLTAPAQNLPL
jgi:hypothetical protein